MKLFPLKSTKLTREHMTISKTAHAGGPWLTVLSPCLETSTVPGNSAKETEVPLKQLGTTSAQLPWLFQQERLQSQRKSKKRTRSKGEKEVRQGLAVFQIPSCAIVWHSLPPPKETQIQKVSVCLLFLCSWAYRHQGKCAATAVTCREISAVYSGLPVSCASGCLLTLPPLPLAVRAANVTVLL